MELKKKLLYFGCLEDHGHFMHVPERPWRSMLYAEDFEKETGMKGTFYPIDGKYTPEETSEQGDAREVDVAPFKIIAWHDYTVDSRPGSNSALVGFGYTSREEMLADATEKFPGVMKRQPVLLKFVKEP